MLRKDRLHSFKILNAHKWMRRKVGVYDDWLFTRGPSGKKRNPSLVGSKQGLASNRRAIKSRSYIEHW